MTPEEKANADIEGISLAPGWLSGQSVPSSGPPPEGQSFVEQAATALEEAPGALGKLAPHAAKAIPIVGPAIGLYEAAQDVGATLNRPTAVAEYEAAHPESAKSLNQQRAVWEANPNNSPYMLASNEALDGPVAPGDSVSAPVQRSGGADGATISAEEQAAIDAQGKGGGGGGSSPFGLSASVMKTLPPDIQRLLAIKDAEARNVMDTRAAIEPAMYDQERQMLAQAEFSGKLSEGYAKEAKELEDTVTNVKGRLDDATKAYHQRLDQGINPAAIFGPGGVSRVNAALLAGAQAILTGNIQAGSDMINGLIDRDIRHQESMINLAGEKTDSLLGEYERELGNRDLARDAYKLNKFEEMEGHIQRLKQETSNQQTLHGLNQQALKIQEEKEQIRLKFESGLYEQELAMRKAATSGRGGGSGSGSGDGDEFGKIHDTGALTTIQGYATKAQSLMDQFESSGEIGMAEQLVERGAPWAANLADDVQSIAGVNEAVRKRDLKTSLSGMQNYILKQMSGAAVSPSEAKRIAAMLPAIWNNPKNFRRSMAMVQMSIKNAINQWDHYSPAQKQAAQEATQKQALMAATAGEQIN